MSQSEGMFSVVGLGSLGDGRIGGVPLFTLVTDATDAHALGVEGVDAGSFAGGGFGETVPGFNSNFPVDDPAL